MVPSGETSRQILAPYSEDHHMGIWITGKRVKGSWIHADEMSSVYELKTYVFNIFKRLGVVFASLNISNFSNDIWTVGQKISNKGGKEIASFGIVSKKQTSKLDITQPVFFADINWTNLMKLIKKNSVSFREIPKYPSVSRDLALLVDTNIQFADIERIAYSSERKLLKDVNLFDVYEGKNLEEGKKSYAVNFVLQDDEKTLNDKQIESIMNKIEQNICKQLNAKVRGK